ncbi:MAG: RelA/SpoT domain-containing protein [Pseudomonadota bacterium]|nr:RelA/SpoT domain-containing protein [Pseudomonadota bacterium]
MEIPKAVIKEAVARYERERDRYLKLSARVADICRVDIVEANVIRAHVTSRAKSARSLEGKLRRFSRNPGKDIQTVDAVFAQIGDLAAVRVATYRPEDQERVVGEICKLFSGPDAVDVAVDRKDKLKEGGFYRATHCQAALRDEELVGTYENLKGTSCEIQICSMMAHVFNEVEHDIAYKPEGGGPGGAETGLMAGLGNLTRTGDAVISQLLAANEVRLKEQAGDFNDAFDFVARMRREFPGVDLSGNSGQLFDELKTLGLTSVDRLKGAIGAERFDIEVATALVEGFNEYVTATGHEAFLLDGKSSDLILVLLLDAYAAQIEENHPAGRGMGRPPRIRSIASRYIEYKKK